MADLMQSDSPQKTQETSRSGHDLASRPHFALTYLAIFAILLGIVLAVNFFGNGDDLFPSPLYPSMSDRAWKTRRLEQLVQKKCTPQVLVLGSSRAMQIAPAQVKAITGKTAFNYAVTGGDVFDCLTQFRYALKIGAKPNLILVNVDEEMLIGDLGPGQLKVAGHSGLFGEVAAKEKLDIACRILKQIDLDTTWKSVQSMQHPKSQSNQRYFRQDTFLFLDDGYRINPKRAFAKYHGVYDLKNEIQRDIFDVSVFQRNELLDGRLGFNSQKIEFLRELFETAKSQNVDVYVFSTPQHPATVGTKRGKIRSELLDDLQTLLQDECKKFGFHYRDFSDLNSFNGDPNEFWDSVHQTPVNMERMTNALLEAATQHAALHLPTEIELLHDLGITEPDPKT